MPLEVKEERKVLLRDLHQQFIVKWSQGLVGRYEYAVTEHLRLSGMYWGLTALSLLDGLHLIDEDKVERRRKALHLMLRCLKSVYTYIYLKRELNLTTKTTRWSE